MRSARSIFFYQLIAQLVVWKNSDAGILLLGDFYENVYTACIAKHLALPDLNFNEQCLRCAGVHIPPTFRDGDIPIDAIYATARIKCVNAFILPHKGGIGDHQCFIFNFTSSSIIRTNFTNIIQCSVRRCHCKLTCLVQTYVLDAICNQHKMYKRIYFIYSHLKYLTDDDFVSLMNGWDTKLTQLKLHSEKNCTIFKNCSIEWSPEVGFGCRGDGCLHALGGLYWDLDLLTLTT
jgi:hypothetical protein